MTPTVGSRGAEVTGPVVVIANPAAGVGRAVQRAATLTDALRHRGIDARLVVPAGPSQAESAAADLAPGARALIGCGGDGTANIVMNAALAAGTPFGLLPAGTGDDNATGLRMAPDPVRAAALIAANLDGRATLPAIDVAWATCADGSARGFLGVMSTGIDSTVNERANGYERLPGTARYVAALAVELRRMAPVEYVVTVDDRELRQPALLASIGNGRSYGGGMLVCPHARVDDGLLDVTVLAHVPRRTFVRVFPRVFRGTHVRHPAVTSIRGARVTVAAPAAVAYADGERFGPLPVTVAVRPRALRLVGAQSA